MWALSLSTKLHSFMKYSIKQLNSTSQLTDRIRADQSKDAIRGFYKGFATQEKIKKRVYGISKTNRSFLCYNGRPIHSVAFTIAKHTPISAVECILSTLLPEFQSLRPELEQLLSEQ